MRVAAAILVLLAIIITPAYAQMASTSGATSSVNISDPSDPANITSTTRLTTVPTIVAPGLAAAGVETCLGSASGGLSLMGTGLTLGSTIPDPGCNLRLTARQLFAFGYKSAAIALMCQDDRVAQAMATVGELCPSAQTAAIGAIGAIGTIGGHELSIAAIDRQRPVVQPRKVVHVVKKKPKPIPKPQPQLRPALAPIANLAWLMESSPEEARWRLAAAKD